MRGKGKKDKGDKKDKKEKKDKKDKGDKKETDKDRTVKMMTEEMNKVQQEEIDDDTPSKELIEK